MKKELNINIDKTENSVRKDTIDYFTSQGFRLTRDENKIILFERGSILNNFVTFNPLKWKSKISINYSNNKVKAEFEINTVGQIATKKEEEMWDSFVSNYGLTIGSGKSFVSINNQELKETKKSQWKYIGHAVLGALIVGLPCIYLELSSGLKGIGTSGAVTGSMIFLFRKINKDKNAN